MDAHRLPLCEVPVWVLELAKAVKRMLFLRQQGNLTVKSTGKLNSNYMLLYFMDPSTVEIFTRSKKVVYVMVV